MIYARSSEALTSRCATRAYRASANRRWNSVRLASTMATPMAKPPVEVIPPRALPNLPLKMLLRSLLVATISSKRFLLIPCLSILSYLSKPERGYLLNVDKNPILHGILKKTFYDQFCAGENRNETVATVQQLKDLGFQGVILTYAKETVFDHKTQTQHGLGVASLQSKDSDIMVDERVKKCANIDTWRKGTLETIDLLGEGDYLAVKLTGAGPVVTQSFASDDLPLPQLMEALDEICIKCRDRKVRILVDAESQHFQWGIMRVSIELMRRYNRDGFALIYNTYQAYLKSTPATLAKHLTAASKDNFTLGLKLVRGAYMNSDQRSLIHDTKQDTDNAYNAIAQGALKQKLGEFGASRPFPSVNLFLASHNKASVLAAHEIHQQRLKGQIPTVPVGFGQLQGMSDEVSFGLLQLKKGDTAPEVYKCSTWGGMGECLAYLLRRAVENRDAVSRTTDEYVALRTEMWRRIKSSFTGPSSTY